MSRTIKITLNPKNNQCNVYTGLTENTITGLTCNNIIDTCSFNVSDNIVDEYIWVKCDMVNCNEQIYKVYVGTP